MHGNYTAVTAMQQADLLIALGSRFDDRVTGKISAFAPDAKIIHVDIDPAELGKVRRPDVAIVGDCRLVIEELLRALDGLGPRLRATRSRRRVAADARERRRPGRPAAARPDLGPWMRAAARLAGGVPARLRPGATAGRSSPSSSSRRCATPPPTTPSWRPASASTRCGPRSTGSSTTPTPGSTPAALGTMGFAVPAAIGAKVGRPDQMVWAVDGDGCFQMTAQELVTASAERIPVKIAILNNAYLGMVRQWQELFYDERYSEVYLSPDLPDYVKWAEAMGCVGLRVESRRGGRPGHREGQRDRRPPRRHRLPHRRLREGVPDGARRRVQRRHHRRPLRGRGRPVTGRRRRSHRHRPAPPHPHRPGREQGRGARPGRRPVLAGAASTSSRWPSPRPTTSGSAGSRSSSTSSRRRSSRSSSSSTSSSRGRRSPSSPRARPSSASCSWSPSRPPGRPGPGDRAGRGLRGQDRRRRPRPA